MKKNLGNVDRAVRVLVALVIVTLYATNVLTGTWGIVLMVASAVFLLTSFVSFCPLYALAGFSTCPMKEKKN